MTGYLTPEIKNAVEQLAQTCDELTRQVLIRELTKKTQEWCAGDPELAETILEGTKTLEGCTKYVLEQAASSVAKSVSAMPMEEVKMLPTHMIGGKKATMAGGAVGAEQAFSWAYDYYYKVKEIKANGEKGKSGKTGQKKVGKNATAATPGKDAGGAEAVTDSAKASQNKKDGGVPEQLTLGGTRAAA